MAKAGKDDARDENKATPQQLNRQPSRFSLWKGLLLPGSSKRNHSAEQDTKSLQNQSLRAKPGSLFELGVEGKFVIPASVSNLGGHEFHWAFNQDLVQITETTLGKQEQLRRIKIKYEDIIELQLIDAFHQSKPSRSQSGKAARVLYLLFRYHKEGSLSIILIPEFGDQLQLLPIQSCWNSKRIRSSIVVDDLFDVLWKKSGCNSGTQADSVFCWVFNRKSLAFCASSTSCIATIVKFAHVIDFVYRPEGSQKSRDNNQYGVLLVRYVARDPVTLEIEESEICVDKFPGQVAFEELCLLWRQELQLFMIFDVFNSVDDTDLTLYREGRRRNDVREQVKRVSFFAPKFPPFTSSASKSCGEVRLRRADSMRKFTDLHYDTDEHGREPSPMQQLFESDSMNQLIAGLEDTKWLQESNCGSEDKDGNILANIESPECLTPPAASSVCDSRAIDYSEEDVQDESPLIISQPPPSDARSVGPEMHMATYSYSKPGPSELALAKNDKIRVVKKDESGWWYGLKLEYKCQSSVVINYSDGGSQWIVVDEGWVPSNYLKQIV